MIYIYISYILYVFIYISCLFIYSLIYLLIYLVIYLCVFLFTQLYSTCLLCTNVGNNPTKLCDFIYRLGLSKMVDAPIYVRSIWTDHMKHGYILGRSIFRKKTNDIRLMQLLWLMKVLHWQNFPCLFFSIRIIWPYASVHCKLQVQGLEFANRFLSKTVWFFLQYLCLIYGTWQLTPEFPGGASAKHEKNHLKFKLWILGRVCW